MNLASAKLGDGASKDALRELVTRYTAWASVLFYGGALAGTISVYPLASYLSRLNMFRLCFVGCIVRLCHLIVSLARQQLKYLSFNIDIYATHVCSICGLFCEHSNLLFVPCRSLHHRYLCHIYFLLARAVSNSATRDRQRNYVQLGPNSDRRLSVCRGLHGSARH